MRNRGRAVSGIEVHATRVVYSLRIIGLAAIGLGLLLAACTGATVGSGVGDSRMDRPPFRAGRYVTSDAAIAHLPIIWQQGAVQESMFDPSASSTEVRRLIQVMNAYLDSLDLSTKLVTRTAETGTRPDIQFGCEPDLFGDECEASEPRRGGRHMLRLAVARPSPDWSRWLQAGLAEAEATHALVITVETGLYWPRQRNLLGSKEIELGTDYSIGLPWLTGLDRPVSVIQLTGAVVDPNGRAVRIAAEGMLARRTDLLVGSIGAQALITGREVQALMTATRDDLPGQPLVWKVALESLVTGLTGRTMAHMADGAVPARAARNPASRN